MVRKANSAAVSANVTWSAAATAALEAALVSANERQADMAAIENTADGSVEITPAAQDVLNITAALAGTADSSPMRAVLEAALATALQVQADVEAAAALTAEYDSEITNAHAAALAFKLAPAVLDSMLAAIEVKYAPAPAVEAAPAPAAPATGRKPVGEVAKARNAAVAAELQENPVLAARALASIEAFDKAGGICHVGAAAGTRYASLVAFAGAGVVNYEDYKILVTAIRQTLALPHYKLSTGGQTVADRIWTSGTGAHAAGESKGHDALYLKFADRRAPALHADGRFYYALPNTPNVRFLHLDASAYAAFFGGAAAASAAPVAPTNTPAAPIVPQAPNVQADVVTGAVTRTARCKHCPTKNVVGAAECRNCKATDWQAE